MSTGDRAPPVRAVLAAAWAAAMLAGCQPRPALMNAEHLPAGKVIVLPGIDGRTVFTDAICLGLREAGVNKAVEVFDWTSPLGPVFNQCAMAFNRARAAELARRIVEYREANPGATVVLVGHSGGSAIAVWALEALPEGAAVEAAVLLAPSLSPGYRLDSALGRTRRGIVSFHSPQDTAVLAVGTSLLGTMDRLHSPAAGLGGFRTPVDGERAAAYGRLFQRPWRPDMARVGHDGGHFSCTARPFVAAYVAPLVDGRP